MTPVILQCRSRFWEKDGCNGFGISDLPQESFHPTFDQPGTRGLLVSYMLTGVGRQAAAMDPDARTAFASQEMEKVHPGPLDNLEGCVSKVWPADPWAGGAGAEHSPGQLTTLCVGIERPEGECILPVNSHRHGLIECRAPCIQGREQQRKCTRLISWVDDAPSGSCPVGVNRNTARAPYYVLPATGTRASVLRPARD